MLYSTISFSSTSFEDEKNPFEKIFLITDIVKKISSYVPEPEDLKNLMFVSKTMNKAIDLCNQQQIEYLTHYTLNKNLTLEELQKETELKEQIPNNVKYKNCLFDHLQEKLGDQEFFLLDSTSVVKQYVDELIEKESISHKSISGYDFYKVYKLIFTNMLFRKNGDQIFQEVVTQHLLSLCTVYQKKDILEEVDLIEFLTKVKIIKEQSNYIRFSHTLDPNGAEIQQTAHIIITDQELDDKNNKNLLQKILENNLDHNIILNVGDQFVDIKGVLHLSADQIPSNLKHFTITNTKENAIKIGDDFISDARDLESFDARGLSGVKSIGNFFLNWPINLEYIDMRGLSNVMTIGYAFLNWASSLQSFDMRGLTNVISIDFDFLLRAENLQSLDVKGLNNLQSIGYAPLSYTNNLKKIIATQAQNEIIESKYQGSLNAINIMIWQIVRK